MRNNINLQDEYMGNKAQIEELFKNGEIVPIRKMFTIEEKDLRPSIEQTPYMQRNGIPDSFVMHQEQPKMISEQKYTNNTSKITRNDFALWNSGYMSPDSDSS